jgi:WD40 repeat protein
MGSLRLRHQGVVNAVEVSADGTLIASSGADNTVHLWEAATGRERHRFTGGVNSNSLAFAPDSASLAFPSGDGKDVIVIDTATGRERARLKHDLPDKKFVRSVAYSPDGKLLVTGGQSTELVVWDAVTFTELRRFGGAALEHGCAQITFVPPEGKWVLAGTYSGAFSLWDVATGNQVPDGPVLRSPSGQLAAFAPDGKTGAVISIGISIYEMPSLLKYRYIPPPKGEILYQVAFAPDGKRIACGSSSGVVRLWDAVTCEELRRFQGHEAEVHRVAFTPDGKTLVSGGADRTVRVWDVDTGRERLPFVGHLEAITWVALSPDARLLATASVDRTVRLWDCVSGAEVRVLRGHKGPVWGVAFAPDGRTLASASQDTTVRLWEVATGRELRRLEGGHKYVAAGLAFAPDGRTLASGGLQEICLWEPGTGKLLRTLKNRLVTPQALAFTPDGKGLLAWEHPEYRGFLYVGEDMEKGPGLWDVATGQELRRYGQPEHLKAVAVAPDGKTLAAGGPDLKIHLLDAATGKELRALGDHKSFVMSLAFSPDGKAIASSSVKPRPGWGRPDTLDPAVHVWETATGKLLRRFAGHQESVWAVTFSADGRLLASGSGDGTAVIWDVGGLTRESK